MLLKVELAERWGSLLRLSAGTILGKMMEVSGPQKELV